MNHYYSFWNNDKKISKLQFDHWNFQLSNLVIDIFEQWQKNSIAKTIVEIEPLLIEQFKIIGQRLNFFKQWSKKISRSDREIWITQFRNQKLMIKCFGQQPKYFKQWPKNFNCWINGGNQTTINYSNKNFLGKNQKTFSKDWKFSIT